FQEMLENLGVEVELGELADVGFAGGRVTVGGRPVDLVLRYFGVGEILDDPAGLAVVDRLVQADADGAVVLYTSLSGELFNNKTSLALLTDLRWSGRLTSDEATLVDTVLPWTRSMTLGQVEVDGATVDLMEYCRQERGNLILKPGADFGGAGITAGWLVDDVTWKAALAEGSTQGAIVQRRVVPRAEPVLDPTTGVPQDWNAVWDCFLTPEGYAGSHIRALPTGGGAVIGMGASVEARTTGIFYYGAGSGGAPSGAGG
ncbi:MAG TPA: hypothetical protein VM677_35025, partial [Actinokineospora sp.]|nr:hypothetical protein [Actinokineospora sp.]